MGGEQHDLAVGEHPFGIAPVEARLRRVELEQLALGRGAEILRHPPDLDAAVGQAAQLRELGGVGDAVAVQPLPGDQPDPAYRDVGRGGGEAAERVAARLAGSGDDGRIGLAAKGRVAETVEFSAARRARRSAPRGA